MCPAPRGLHGVLVHDLGRKIVEGTYPAGTALSHELVGAEYDASRPTVREALRVLEAKGMLRIRQSLGTRVQPPDQWNLLDADVVAWRLQGLDRAQQARELVEMRLAVEPVAASLTASRADPEALRAIASAFSAMEVAVSEDDAHAFTEADVAFHAALLMGAGNQMFTQLTSLIATALEAREEVLTQHHVDLSPAALQQHGAVLSSIRDGDGDKADRAMRQMLSGLLVEESMVVDGPATGQGADAAAG